MPEDFSPQQRTKRSLVEQQLTSQTEIVDLLTQLRRVRAVLTCFMEGGVSPVGARIELILPAADALILFAASDIEHHMLSAAEKLILLASMRGTRIQFDSKILGCVRTSVGPAIRISMPKSILRLQRRAHSRIRPPRVPPLQCMVRGETNLPSQQRLVVLDIGIGGVALLGRANDRFTAGERLLNCSFNLGKEGGFTTDLSVRNVERADGAGGWRYGCEFAGITARALERVCGYVERIEAQRQDALLPLT